MNLSLYRKYRSSTFDEIIGQEHIKTTLINQVESKNINHAYLFTGSRGTGKTSTAKIFAKAINCLNPQNGSPCGKCEVCLALGNETNIDVVEIDAASNNRVDEIRDIREKVKFLPINCKYKVYIIDEVHMLTDSAFNALLKTLEEPPAHIVFILATTEVHKLPATILSRCMRFDFHLINEQTLAEHLRKIFEKENVVCNENCLNTIVKSAEGSVRDMLSIASSIIAYSNGNITEELVERVLGNSDVAVCLQLIKALANKNIENVFEIIHSENQKGKNMTVLCKQITVTARNLLVCKTCKNANDILMFTSEVFNKFNDCATDVNTDMLMEYMKIFSSVEAEMKYAISPKSLLETACVIAISEADQKKN